MKISAKDEERILKSYEKLLNWGVKKFIGLTDLSIGAEDIKQEGRIAILNLIRKYDPEIGTLDGYIKSFFYKVLRNRLKISNKKFVFLSIDEEKVKPFIKGPNENLIEKIMIIKENCTNYELKKLLDYANGSCNYKDVKRIISKIRRRLD